MLGELVEALDMLDVYTISDERLSRALFSEPPEIEVVIARYKGEPAGFVTWTEWIHLVAGDTAMSFDYIYVRPQFRSYQITMALLIYLLVLAKRRGYFRIEGVVHEWNTETSNFYKSLHAEEIPQQIFRLNLSENRLVSPAGVSGRALNPVHRHRVLSKRTGPITCLT